MFKKAYQDKNLAPENLSRTLEDSGTVTSVLIPWNTCGAYQSGVLGVGVADAKVSLSISSTKRWMDLGLALVPVSLC